MIRCRAVAKHVEGCLVTNRIRCLRNLLARLLSLRDHQVAGTDSCQEARNLMRKIQRCPYLPSGLGLTAQILHVTEDIRKAEAELKQGQLARWRDRLRGSVTACYKWVRGTSCAYTHMVCLGDELSSDSLSDALDRLKSFWENVWNRPLPNLDHQFASCAQVLGPARETAVWSPLQGSELQKAAHRQAGTSPGPDGWTGDELACIHLDIWACLASFFNRYDSVGVTPSSWKNLRQIHLPKDGKPKRETDRATPAANHRPIAVLSCFWRTWASARLKSESVQRWTRTWVPDEAYGGRRGVGTYNAVASLLDGIHNSAYLGTFDYSLAFDCVRPRLVERLWTHFGMPNGALNMVMSVWCGQRRYLQLFDAVCPTPALVSTSIPQGDPWSMLAMVCMLVAPLVDIKGSRPGAVVSLYVDDRSWITDTAASCLRVAQQWRDWSARLGLTENGDKDQFFQISRAGRRKLVDEGADPRKVTDSPNFLAWFSSLRLARSPRVPSLKDCRLPNGRFNA